MRSSIGALTKVNFLIECLHILNNIKGSDTIAYRILSLLATSGVFLNIFFNDQMIP